MASEENKGDDVAAIELPAPAGWIKKCTPKKGGTPQRNDILFVSPTGEEIKNKRQLDQYLKSHPGGPAVSEFVWATGDTPRRSARLSGKSKAAEALASPSPNKKRKTSGTKGAREKSNALAEGEATDEKDAATEETKESAEATDEKGNAHAEGEATDGKGNAHAEGEATDEKDAAAEETKGSAEASVVDAKDAAEGEIVAEEALPKNPNIEDVEMKTVSGTVLDEPSAVVIPNDTNVETSNANVEEFHDVVMTPNDADNETLNANVEEFHDATTKTEESEVETKVSGAKIDESEEEAKIRGANIDEFKEASSEVQGAKNDDVSTDACHAEKEAPAGKVDSADTVVVDQDNSKEKQAAGKSIESNPTLPSPTTGS